MTVLLLAVIHCSMIIISAQNSCVLVMYSSVSRANNGWGFDLCMVHVGSAFPDCLMGGSLKKISPSNIQTDDAA